MVFRNWAEQPRSSKMATISREHQTSRTTLAIKENDIRLLPVLEKHLQECQNPRAGNGN